MKKNTRIGFTLVELLVVISIIGMLAGMLLPAVQSAREAGRRAFCMNNQRNIALAFLNYESNRSKFPQFVNNVTVDWNTNQLYAKDGTSNTLSVSWLPVLFPYLDSAQLWDNLVKGGSSAAGGDSSSAFPSVTLSFLHCKSKGSQETGGMSYVANCGYNDGLAGKRVAAQIGDITKNNGVLNNGVGASTTLSGLSGGTWIASTAPKLTIDDIKDGTTNTIIVSENLQAAPYAEHAFNGTTWTGTAWPTAEYQVGFCWAYTGGSFAVPTADCAALTTATPSAEECPIRINKCGAEFEGTRLWATARPSSMHPGTVVIAMCDGSVRTLNEGVDINPYIRAMSPCDKKCVYTAINTGVFDVSELD